MSAWTCSAMSCGGRRLLRKRSNGSGSRPCQNLGVSLEDPDFIAGAVLNRLIYGFHPYGFPDSGMPETIAKITRDDLREFHRRYFAPNNSILAIVGDVTAEEAMAAATRVFGDWQRQPVKPPTLPEPPKPTRRIVIIDKPDSVQTAVRIGQLAFRERRRTT